MAEGGREPDAFKLTLRIEFSAETSLNEDAITKVKNSLQGNLTLLQKHFQEDVKYECLHLKQIRKFKKCVLGFELLIYSSDELEQIKALTTERQLDKALSAFSDKHDLYHIAGLDAKQGLQFLCKLEDQHFYEGKVFFSKKLSDLEEDEEEDEEEEQQQHRQKQQLSEQPSAMTASPGLTVHQQDSSQSGVSEKKLQLPQEHQQPEANRLEESTEQTMTRSTLTEQATTSTEETTAALEASTSTTTKAPTKTSNFTMSTTTESTVVPTTNTATANITSTTQPLTITSTIVATTSSKTVIPSTRNSEADITSTSTQSIIPTSVAITDITTTTITTMPTTTSSSTTEQATTSSITTKPTTTTTEATTTTTPEASTSTTTKAPTTTTTSTMAITTESTDVHTTSTTTVTNTCTTQLPAATSTSMVTTSSRTVIPTITISETDITSTTTQSATTESITLAMTSTTKELQNPTSTTMPTSNETTDIKRTATGSTPTPTSSSTTEQTMTRSTTTEPATTTTEATTTTTPEASTSTTTKAPTATTTSTTATTTESTDVPTTSTMTVTNTCTTQLPAATSTSVATTSSTTVIPTITSSEADITSTTTQSATTESITSAMTSTMTELQNPTSTTMPTSNETTDIKRTATGSTPTPTSSSTTEQTMTRSTMTEPVTTTTEKTTSAASEASTSTSTMTKNTGRKQRDSQQYSEQQPCQSQNPRKLLEQSPVQHAMHSELQKECSGEQQVSSHAHVHGPQAAVRDEELQQQQNAEKLQFSPHGKQDNLGKTKKDEVDARQKITYSIGSVSASSKRLKKLYLFLPNNDGEIEEVFLTSEAFTDSHRDRLYPVSKLGHLWELHLELYQSVLDNNIMFQFGFVPKEKSKTSGKVKLDRKFIMTGSSVQRLMWEKATYHGVLTHMKHILQNCSQDVKDSFLQVEELAYVAQKDVKLTEQIFQDIQEELSDTHKLLLFAVMIAKFSNNNNIEVFLHKLNKGAIEILVQAVRLSAEMTDVPSTSIECLRWLSYWVIKRLCMERFCLVLWMKYMFPIHSESFFLSRLKDLPICHDDEASAEHLRVLCEQIRVRILRQESQKGEDLLCSIFKEVDLLIGLKVYHQVFDGVHLQEFEKKLKGILSSRIPPCALHSFNSKAFGKLNDLWSVIRGKTFDSEVRVTFEKYVLELMHEAIIVHHHGKSLHQDWCKLCEDEVLFVSVKNQQTLLTNISRSDQKEMHNYLIKLANLEKFKKRLNFDVVQLWFDTAVDKHVGDRMTNNNLVQLYCYLCDALILFPSRTQKEEQDLKDILVAKEHKFGIKPSDLLKRRDQIVRMSSNAGLASEILNSHVKSLLKKKHRSENPEDIIHNMCQNHLVFDEWQVDLLQFLLEQYGPKGQSEQDMFMSMISFHGFWKSVLEIQGKFSSKVRSLNVFHKADKSVAFVRNMFINLTVSLEFLKSIVLNKMENKVEALILTDEFTKEKFETVLKEYQRKLSEEEEKKEIVKSTLQSVLNNCKEAKDSGVSVIQNISDTVGKRLMNGQISILQMKSLWHPYETVPDICRDLMIPVQSQVFWNKWKEGKKVDGNETKDETKQSATDYSDEEQRIHGDELEGQDDAKMITDVCDMEKKPGSHEGLTFLESLSRRGCDMYRNVWNDFFQGNDLPLSTIQEVFKYVKDIKQEIELVEKFVGNQLNKKSKSALMSYFNRSKYENIVNAMIKLISAFNINVEHDKEFMNAAEALENVSKGMPGNITLFDFHFAFTTVEEASGMLNKEAVKLLNILGKSLTLISFLTEIVDEDLRNLIDGVDEVYARNVKASTVSGLIEVKQFLYPFLTKDSKLRQSRTVFFTEFSKKLQKSVFEAADHKITDCMDNLYNLKQLYDSLAKRSENTRESIQNIVQHGKFNFFLRKHVCVFTVALQGKKESTYPTPDLVGLKSRALLLMNTARKEDSVEKSEETNEYLRQFLQYINTGLEIAELCTSLHVSGHFKYMEFDKEVKPIRLNDFKLQLERELDHWQKDIMNCRKKHYYMNFLNGGQIQMLYSYLETGTIKDARVIDIFLKFIHPNASTEGIQTVYMSLESDKSNLSALMNMGIVLEHTCKHLTPIRRTVESSDSGVQIVQKGKLLVTSLPKKSKLVINTVLGLYQNKSKAMPEAHQLLFCHPETTWDEVDLLLKRCLEAHKFGSDSLFCLANVEMLPNEKQFQLVDALRKLPKDGMFFLAIVFRGAEHNPFLHEFSNCVTHVYPVTSAFLKKCLKSKFSGIYTVTSDVPGLGKTETVKRHAHQIRKKCVTLHVSGPQSKKTLVERFLKLEAQKDFVLHIDIGNTPHPEELDTFLFELLVLRYVSAYTGSIFLTSDTVYIEIANTMNNILRDSLHIVTSFKRKHLKWLGFDNLQISSELHSSVQVVCLYLDALENGTLDKRNIDFKDTKAMNPLPREKCTQLLQNTLISKADEVDLSYNIINTFLRVLADQLMKLSSCRFFRIAKLSAMLGRKDRPSVKTALVKEMVDLSIDFAFRSEKSCTKSKVSSVKKSEQKTNKATSVADQVKGMIRWEDSNHLMFLFHSQDVQTLSALYRDVEIIPEHIKTLFESQMKKKLPDFNKMNQKALQDILQKITRSNPNCLAKEQLEEMSKYYALTPDNILKMVLIVLRVRAHIPIIVIGETGCGKTSLIDYLSKMCDVECRVMCIHSGIDEECIINTVKDVNKEALNLIEKKQQIWLFLDEINTNDHLWVISDIICHHSCLGTKLAPNLVLMAACNPCRLRSESSIHTAGLEGRARTDELSRLLYRVHPLPETMVYYVWDFGSLSKADEKMYIFQMVCGKLGLSKEKEQLLTDALVISQEFMRTAEGVSCCVSLRDVRRCTDLTMWFKDFLKSKKVNCDSEIEVRSIILALALCYHCRLIHSKKRKEYREALYQAFKDHHESEYNEKKIKCVIRDEQNDILDRMELPAGIAKNTALQENVFVILVSILNRIPIFVVGKPGSSKSLSMQVIRSNLRGLDSKDELFKSLPQLYCVSFQGSESSTSEGISKVFKKAQKYQKLYDHKHVISVVILDEIGLAEESRFNPLKVLHSLLEPKGKPHPDVAVVGISNWVLDASKMNRAIHLSRPEMDEEELFETGKAISDSVGKSSDANCSGVNLGPKRELEELNGIARGYLDFVDRQRFKNIFGLRDYYSLVKYYAKELNNLTDDEINPNMNGQIILKGIQRNFGGLPLEMGSVKKCFGKHIKVLIDLHVQSNVPVLDLINENVQDRFARHLLLITSGDSVLGILEKQLRDLGREHVTIFGSKFEEDLTDDYSYRILSQIILYMEQGLVLILKDLENIYGSLYDMLNQNYTMVGNKKHCRIALGQHSNPMCSVHDDFKCIVLVKESELDYSDPPFLNRFEKQRLQYSEILSAENESVVTELEDWISSVSSIPGKRFSREDIFPLYSKNMAPSLVLQVLSVHDCSLQVRTEACKMKLLEVMKPEAIVRLKISEYGQNHSEEDVKKLLEMYFSLPLHDGLEHFVKTEIEKCRERIGKLLVVFTNSNIHTDLNKLMPKFNSQIEKLGAFKSEKQFMMQMEQFWQSSDRELLFLQCKADIDGAHILLSKSIIEKFQAKYSGRDSNIPKHVCLVVHLGRNSKEAKTVPQIDFLTKWKLVMLDSLERPRTRLPELSQLDLMKTIKLRRPLDDCIKKQLFTAFACIKYGTCGRSNESILELVKKIGSCPKFLSYLQNSILKWIKSYSTDVDSWQVQVSCDVNVLYTASSLIEALEGHLLSVVYKPLAMLIYELEKQSLLDSFFVSGSSEQKRQVMWSNFFSKKKMFTIDCTPLPTGPECFALSAPVLKLRMPFSKLFFERVDAEKDYFYDLLTNTLLKNEADEIKDLDIKIVQSLHDQFSDLTFTKVAEVQGLEYENLHMDYVHDFCTLVVAKHSPENINNERINVMYWLLTQGSKLSVSLNKTCTMLHTTYWTDSQLIMAEFMLIETCRKLRNIEDILQEIFGPIIFGEQTQEIEVDERTEAMIEEEMDDVPTLQSTLVDKLCKKIIPVDEILQFNEDLEKWNKMVQSILSVASRVSKDSSVVFALRFCSDLTALILIPNKMGHHWLLQFGNLLLRDISMHSEEFLKKVTELLQFLQSSISSEDQQKIYSQFFLRCLQASNNRDVVDWLLQMVKEKRVPDCQLSHLKSSLHYAIYEVTQSTICDIIDADPEDSFKSLQENENKVLSKLDSSIRTSEPHQQDHHLATLLVDIFEKEIFKSQFHVKEIAAAIQRLDKVERIILEEKFSLRQLLGIAFYRQFMKGLGVELQKTSLEPNILKTVDNCLTSNKMDDKNKRLSVQLFLLKVLKSSLRFQTFYNLICQKVSSELTFIATLWKCKSPWKSIDSAPLALHNKDLHRIATNALEVFDTQKCELQNFVKKAAVDPDQMVSLHSVLMQHFYLKKTVSANTAYEITNPNDVQELCSKCKLDETNFRLIQCHLGIEDYKKIDVLDLNLNDGTEQSDMQIASFVVELASLASSFNISCSNSFTKCLLKPGELGTVFLPGMDDVREIKSEPIQPTLTTTQTSIGTCINRHRFTISNCKEKIEHCPVCFKEIETKGQQTRKLYCVRPESDGIIPGRNLTAISQHLLQMIIHGLFTASLALGYSEVNDLSTIIKRSEEEKDVAKYLYLNIKRTLKYLEGLMGMRQTDLDYFLHVLLVETKSLMWDNSNFDEESERDSWEEKFDKMVNSLVQKRFIAVQCAKKQVLELHGLDKSTVEYQVEEVDEVGWCPCLFRLTMEPSQENLSLELYQGKKADSFPFLDLVLKVLPQLELIQHIRPLISWHKACVIHTSFQKKKANIKESDYTVSKFIHEVKDKKLQEILKKKFKSCKETWNSIKEKATLLNPVPIMDKMHDLSRVESCLILDISSPMYKVIEILVSMQNDFLDETLALSLGKKYVPALEFLKKDTACSYLPCVAIADVKKDNIITFKWSERYLQSSQCNIMYGQGRQIKYDFRTIEMELANSLLLGKCYLLLNKSFPRIIFTDELYKSYILMIQELKEVIPQKELTSDIEEKIKSLNDSDPQLIADFLSHLGIIISLLRRSGGNPETPLVEFFEKWNSFLVRPFPTDILTSLECDIKLCHIVQLNELLEELGADGSIESLENCYEVQLDKSSVSVIDSFLSKSAVIAEVVLKAEKRFVHRCLLHKEVEPTDSLLSYLSNNYFWPMGSIHDGKLEMKSHSVEPEVKAHSVLLADIFPSDVQVQHISYYIQCLTKTVEDLKPKKIKTNKKWKKDSEVGFYLQT